MTAARRTGNRKLLPLLVHPATLAAQDVEKARRAAADRVPVAKAARRAPARKPARRSR